MPIRQEDKGNTKIVKLGQKRQGQRIKVEPFGQEEENRKYLHFLKCLTISLKIYENIQITSLQPENSI